MRTVCFLLLMVLLAGPVAAGDDSRQKALKLYKLHRYQEAWQKLQPVLQSAPPDRAEQMHLSLGLICYDSALLYRQLYRFSLITNRDYLQRLMAQKNRSVSRLAPWYLAKTLMQSGDLANSAALIETFLAGRPEDTLDSRLARVDLGTVRLLQGSKDSAGKLWASVESVEPVIQTALAAAYSRGDRVDKNPKKMCRDALAAIKAEGGPPSIRVSSNALAVYAAEGLLDDARRLLLQADLKGCFAEEALLENKVIRFYDPALLKNLADYFGRQALDHFQTAAAASNPKIKNWARVSLLDAQLLLGRTDEARQAARALLAANSLPGKLQTRVAVRQAVVEHLTGSKQVARKQLQAILDRTAYQDAAADLLLTCEYHRVDFQEAVVKSATLAHHESQGRMARLNLALGTHYLRSDHTAEALAYLEAGRDKSNKNRIENNDPLLLVALAQAYYRQRYYSEALEILFEMSKQFKAVRQLQVSIQGVYSMEQKSAGDAKLF